MTPALLGSANSSVTSWQEMLLSTSIRNGPLKPMLNGPPSYSHMMCSSADVEKSMSCADVVSVLLSRCSLISELLALADTDTRRRALMKALRSTSTRNGVVVRVASLDETAVD